MSTQKDMMQAAGMLDKDGMQNVFSKWDIRFLQKAEQAASWSKDPSTKVGAIIVDDLKRVIGLGYNGFPRGVEDTPERYGDRPLKYEMVVHAEANAILNAIAPVRGQTMYCTNMPCPRCAGLIIQAGVKKVIFLASEWERKNMELLSITETMFTEAGVEFARA